jgi:hypothetical protein
MVIIILYTYRHIIVYEYGIPSNVGRASHTIIHNGIREREIKIKRVCVDKCVIRIFLRLSVIFRFSFPETGPFREPLNYLNVERDKNDNIIMYKCILNGFFFDLESMNCMNITRRDDSFS